MKKTLSPTIRKSLDELANVLAHEKGAEHQGTLESTEEHCKRTQLHLQEGLEAYYHRVLEGYEVLLHAIVQHPEGTLPIESFVITEEYSPGKNFQEAFGFSNEAVIEMCDVGIRLLAEEKWEKAAKAFTFLLTLNPDLPSFWIGLGNAEEGKGLIKEAIPLYEMAIATNPAYFEGYRSLVHVFLRLKRGEEALKAIQGGVHIAPELRPQLEKLREIIP